MKKYYHKQEFFLESGKSLQELEIAYTTYGKVNETQDNIVWICHALTANADPAEWWDGLVGEGKFIDTEKYFVVCANMLGSCYGSTNARSISPVEGKPYGQNFPIITIRDMIGAHQLLQQHLGIKKIKLALGGSMGGQQVLEWAITDPDLFEHICVIATNAFHSPWGIAFNEAQRMAIEADETIYEDIENAGKKGLEAARAIAMLSYRNYRTFRNTQSEDEVNKIDDFRASSYQRYQGVKLHNRFDVLAYLTLSKAMDSHQVGRGREGAEIALAKIRAKTLVVGIETDVLFPVEEQVFIAKHIPGAQLEVIDSLFGHDGFLIENEILTEKIDKFLKGKNTTDQDWKKYNGTAYEVFSQFKKIKLPGSEKI